MTPINSDEAGEIITSVFRSVYAGTKDLSRLTLLEAENDPDLWAVYTSLKETLLTGIDELRSRVLFLLEGIEKLEENTTGTKGGIKNTD